MLSVNQEASYRLEIPWVAASNRANLNVTLRATGSLRVTCPEYEERFIYQTRNCKAIVMKCASQPRFLEGCPRINGYGRSHPGTKTRLAKQ